MRLELSLFAMGSCLVKPPQTPRAASSIAPYCSPHAKRPRLRLYGAEMCPFTSRIRIALHFKGLQVQSVWADADEMKGKKLQLVEFMVPDGKLPILQHDELNVCGSSDEILEYIEATFPKPSLLHGGSLAKDVQEWVVYVRDTFSPLIVQVLYDGDPLSQKERAARLHGAFAELDGAIAKHSAKGQFFFGDRFSLVDVYLIPFLLLARPLAYFCGVDINPSLSHLLSYNRRMTTFPSYSPVSMDLDLLQMSVDKALAETASPPLIALTMLQHDSMLAHLDKLVHSADELTVATMQTAKVIDPVKGSLGMQIRKLATQYGHLLDFMLEHAQMEERVIFPALERADRGLTKSANQSHARDLPVMNGIKEDLKGVLALTQGSPGRSEALHGVATRLRALQAHTVEHFQEEETELLPLLSPAGVGSKQQRTLVGKCLNVMESLHGHLLPFLLSGLRPHQIHQYLDLMQKCVEGGMAISTIGSLKNSDEEYGFIWNLVKGRLPELAASWGNAASG